MSSADPGMQRLPTLHAQTVLVVEDEIFVRCAVGDYLRTCGMHVIEAANAVEAIRVLASGTDIDLVFSDVQMPSFVDGIGWAQWVALDHPSIKLILTAGPAERSWDAATGRVILPKPYDHRDLEAKIRQLLGQRAATRTCADVSPAPEPGPRPLG